MGSACPETTRPHTLRRTCCINYRNRPLLCSWGHRGVSRTSASLCSGLLMLASPNEDSVLFPSPTSLLQSFLLWSLRSTILCFGHTNAKPVQQAMERRNLDPTRGSDRGPSYGDEPQVPGKLPAVGSLALGPSSD